MLHVRMLPNAVRRESGDWHVQLACGNVTSRGSLNFSVKWRTPSGLTLGSSFTENGEEILNVSPAEEGNYSCFLDIDDSTARCVDISPAMLVSNEVHVDTCSVKPPLSNLVQREKREMESVFQYLARQHDTIRLVNGSKPWNGRVEVKYNGSWAVVCDDLFSVWSATVVCTMLGVTGGAPEVRSDSFYGEGELPILLDDVMCRGNESSIFDCSHRPLGVHNCHRSEIVGVDCLSQLTSS
ncbi:antigen WC1.1-like [Pomacea canaliculata]|uniref:antigen WC1.1-like n=1 Tax=Pomacea canaliculata TaxID=400727 RepID=UPI000D730575|nr:antigen WC1.1-like [Pomacea canaliculata]